MLVTKKYLDNYLKNKKVKYLIDIHIGDNEYANLQLFLKQQCHGSDENNNDCKETLFSWIAKEIEMSDINGTYIFNFSKKIKNWLNRLINNSSYIPMYCNNDYHKKQLDSLPSFTITKGKLDIIEEKENKCHTECDCDC